MVETFAFNVNGVSKTYVGRRSAVAAVDGVDLHVAKGQFVAICGQSGSGKSTLLALVGGLCRPTAGSVTVGESDLGQLTPSGLADFRGRQVGFVFQFSSLLPNLRAIDNVALAALLQTGGGYPRAYAAARACLAEVGLANRETAFPRELSGGQQRRVAIARALVNRPGLLLADEPTSDLDEQTAEEIFALLRRVQQAHGATLVLVTHDTRLARSADRLIYLHQGRIVEDLVPDRVDARLQPIERVAWPPPLHEASPSACSPADEPIQPLGAGLGRFVIDFLGWTFAVTLAIFAINHLTAGFQQRTVSREQDSRRQIEELAFRGMRSNVEDLVEQSDGSFLLTLSLENLAAE
ncbi:MAG TPA: ABC transporter ATP-binding protein, partial [Pirellulales bacterium]|nr:ABC transporter ATP-binding protein [Pirellulales bacterium]